MQDLPNKIAEAKKQGYNDMQIADYLASRGYGDQIAEARNSGYDYGDIVRHLSGEKRGFGERIKQGAASFYLGTKQAADYLGSKFGDVEIGTGGINFLSPDDVKARSEITNLAVDDLNRQKGEPGLGAELLIAAGNPVSWMAPAGGGSLLMQGAKAGGAYEFTQPTAGGFDPTQKAQDTAISAAIGGVGSVAAGKAFDLAQKLPGVQVAKKGITAAIAPFTTSGARARAANRLQNVSPSPEDALARLDDPTIAQSLTPAKRSGDQGLLGIEQAARARSPEVDVEIAGMDAAARRELADAMQDVGAGGSMANTTEFISGRRDAVINRMQERAQEAQARAQQRISQLTPERRASEASLIAREELEAAMKASRAVERRLWESIPGRGLTTAGSRKSYKEMVGSLPKAQQQDIPQVARQFLDPQSPTKFRNIESAKELQGLRSKLLDEARAARSGGEFNKARIADMLADSILDDLGAQAGNVRGPAGEALRRALDYSRTQNETYRQGAVGRILRPDMQGGDRVAAEMTLETAIGAGKTRGDVSVSQLLKAADTPAMRGSVNDYMLNRLQTTAFRNGEFNPDAAQRFIRDNQEILDKLPAMRKSLDEAISAQQYAARMGVRSENLSRALLDKKKSRTAEFLGAPVEQEFDRILASGNPAALARQIRLQVQKDPTGEALDGLKSGIVQTLMRKASQGIDEAGNPILSGAAIRNTLNDPRASSALREVLWPEEISRFSQIARELQMLDTGRARAAGGVISDKPNRLIEYFGRIMAARSGANFGRGGASLQTAGMASSNAKELMGRLTNDKAEDMLIRAVTDDKLFKALLTDVGTPPGMALAERRLNEWLRENIAYAVPVMTEMQQDRELPIIQEPSGFMPSGVGELPGGMEVLDEGGAPMELPAPQSSIDSGTLQAFAQAESSGNPNARNPHPDSTASGLYQFTDPTWALVVRKWGKDHGLSMRDKNDPRKQELATRLLAEDNARILSRDIPRPLTRADLYTAHVFGASGAKRILLAGEPRQPATTLFAGKRGLKVINANKPLFFHKGKDGRPDPNRPRSVAELRQLLAQKVQQV